MWPKLRPQHEHPYLRRCRVHRRDGAPDGTGVAAMTTYSGERNPFFGRRHTEKTKAKMRAARLGTSAPWMAEVNRRRTLPLAERFEAKVNYKDDGCWEWLAGRDRKGYGRFSIGRLSKPAHRVSYELFVGPIPTGLQVDHLCRNRACVNPAHLEPVTCLENVRRSALGIATANRVACRHGHPYSPENTYVRKSGARACRTCRREQDARRRRAA